MAKDPNEKLRLVSDHLERNPRRRLGAQKGKMMQCASHPVHGFHPQDEECPMCLGWAELMRERTSKARTEPGLTAYTPTAYAPVIHVPATVRKSAAERYYEWWTVNHVKTMPDWDTITPRQQDYWAQEELEDRTDRLGGIIPWD